MSNSDIKPTPGRKGHFSQAERGVALSAFAQLRVPQDQVVLSDEVMEAVLLGQRRFSLKERQALLSSPVSLRRFRYLEQRRLLAEGAANAAIERWQRSVCELSAAASVGPDSTHKSADGLWALHALSTQGTTRLLLQLLPAPAGAPATARPQIGDEVAVLDGAGTTLLLGCLDADGELQAVWHKACSLSQHLQQHGGTWSVERVG